MRVVVNKPLQTSGAQENKKNRENFSSWLKKIPFELLQDVYRHYRIRRDIPIQPFTVDNQTDHPNAESMPSQEELANNTLPTNMPIVLHRSVFFLIFTLLGIELFFDLIYLGVKIPSMYIPFPVARFLPISVESFLFILFIVLNIGKILFMIVAALQWVLFTYEVTEQEIRYKYGILNRNEKIFLLSYTQEVMYTQSLMGKFCNYGTIEMYNPTLKERVYLDAIPNPEKYTEIVKSYLLGLKDSNYMPLQMHN